MPFYLYSKISSFTPKNPIVREKAVNAHIMAINNLRRDIIKDKKFKDNEDSIWVVVI